MIHTGNEQMLSEVKQMDSTSRAADATIRVKYSQTGH